MKNPLKKNQTVYFIGESIPMKVLAVSERYAVCVRKLDKSEDRDLLEFEVKQGARLSIKDAYDNLKENPVYTILDFQEQIRGSDNYVFGMYDYFDGKDCQAAINDIESGGMEISHRNSVQLNIDWERTNPKLKVEPSRNTDNYSTSSNFYKSSDHGSNSEDSFISSLIQNDTTSSDSSSSSSNFDGFSGGGDFGGGGASGDW